jgi:PPM family protein phosphatase
MNCHQCGGAIAVDDRFCEECGVMVATTTPDGLDRGCQKCGALATKIDPEGYCIECGFRQVVTNDSIEIQIAPDLAGVTDRGHRHHQNEDAIALKIIDSQTYIIVVCDGVSSSQHPELASEAAVNSCLQTIEISIQQGNDPATAIDKGVAAALEAVTKIPIDPTSSVDPSSTTIVTAIVRDRLATIGWLGDSRAYWISTEKSLQLTQDDSWMRDAIESGAYTPAAAEASPYAHAIVRWLGADTADDGKPSMTTFEIPTAGYLVLCTDGLWNYAPDPAYIHHLIAQAHLETPTAIGIASYLTRYANQQGGQDNITVGIFVASS